MRLVQGMAGLILGNAQGATDLRPTVAFRHFSTVFAPPEPLAPRCVRSLGSMYDAPKECVVLVRV